MFEMFERPIFLVFILLAIPAILFFYRQRSAIGSSDISLYRRVMTLPFDFLVKLLLCVAVISAIVAAAAPFELHPETVPVNKTERHFVIVLDSSGSMSELAGSQPKIRIAKEVIGSFTASHPQDAIGLVSFTSYATFEWVVGKDHQQVVKQLEELKAYGGTSIATGLLLGLTHLQKAGSGGALILVSDGEDTVGEGDKKEIARLVEETGTNLYWIWIGATMSSGWGEVISSLGGQIYMTTPAGLASAFSEISSLEQPTMVFEEKTVVIYHTLPFLLIAVVGGFVVLILEAVKEVE